MPKNKSKQIFENKILVPKRFLKTKPKKSNYKSRLYRPLFSEPINFNYDQADDEYWSQKDY